MAPRKPVTSSTSHRLQLCGLVATLLVSVLLCYIGFLLALRATSTDTDVTLTLVEDEGQAADQAVKFKSTNAETRKAIRRLPPAARHQPKISEEQKETVETEERVVEGDSFLNAASAGMAFAGVDILQQRRELMSSNVKAADESSRNAFIEALLESQGINSKRTTTMDPLDVALAVRQNATFNSSTTLRELFFRMTGDDIFLPDALATNSSGDDVRDGAVMCVPQWKCLHSAYRMLNDEAGQYIAQKGKRKRIVQCFAQGTNLTAFHAKSSGKPLAEVLKELGKPPRCPCLPSWKGVKCSIPDVVRQSYEALQQREPVYRLSNPRRVINAFPFDDNFEMLEARMLELGDVVDIFLVLESNFTDFGDSKPLRLRDRLLNEQMGTPVGERIVHVYLDRYPEEAKIDPRVLDDLRFNYLATQGVQRQLVGLRDDDIFLLNDASELPSRQVVTFLKLHTGYGEPVGLRYNSTVFGYYWKAPAANTQIYSAVTVGFLRDALAYEAAAMRRDDFIDLNLGAINHRSFGDIFISNATDTADGFHPWIIGVRNDFSAAEGVTTKPADENEAAAVAAEAVVGWQCLWCCNKRCIVDRLQNSRSAYNTDHPQWATLDADVVGEQVDKFIGEGRWFDGVTEFEQVEVGLPMHAPGGLLNRSEKYGHLLSNENAALQRT